MPTPVREIISEKKSEIARFSIEPALNAAHSLLLIHRIDEFSGLGDWVLRTARAMSAEERERNDLVMEGFYYLATPRRSWPSFPAFVDDIAQRDALQLRDDLMDSYEIVGRDIKGKTDFQIDATNALEDADRYVAFLLERFGADHLNEALEREAYKYMIQPEALQELIVSHLRHMWATYLEAEWERVRPMLRDSVAAFRQVDLSGMKPLEAMEFVTGRGVEKEHWVNTLETIDRLVFVPSTHIGPYTGQYFAENTLWVLFGARVPEGVEVNAPDLSRADIVVRLNALADDDRLRTLKLISERGEMKSQEVMEALGFSQSACSRHLKQLSASGFLTERRCGGAKCYQLNPARIERTMDAVAKFLVADAR